MASVEDLLKEENKDLTNKDQVSKDAKLNKDPIKKAEDLVAEVNKDKNTPINTLGLESNVANEGKSLDAVVAASPEALASNNNAEVATEIFVQQNADALNPGNTVPAEYDQKVISDFNQANKDAAAQAEQDALGVKAADARAVADQNATNSDKPFTGEELRPANWNVESNEDGIIVATCGGRTFKGTSAEFQAKLTK